MSFVITGLFVLSFLYIISGIYVSIRYRDLVYWTLPFTLFALGSAIFIALNRHWWFVPEVPEWITSVVVILLFFTWILIMLSVRSSRTLRQQLMMSLI